MNETTGNELIFYVAANGDDRFSGTLAEPNAERNNGPFATIARARDAVREARRRDAASAKKSARVLIRGGTYFLAETLVFRPEDSGTADAPIVYAAYPGETPIFSGGRSLSNWRIETLASGATVW